MDACLENHNSGQWQDPMAQSLEVSGELFPASGSSRLPAAKSTLSLGFSDRLPEPWGRQSADGLPNMSTYPLPISPTYPCEPFVSLQKHASHRNLSPASGNSSREPSLATSLSRSSATPHRPSSEPHSQPSISPQLAIHSGPCRVTRGKSSTPNPRHFSPSSHDSAPKLKHRTRRKASNNIHHRLFQQQISQYPYLESQPQNWTDPGIWPTMVESPNLSVARASQRFQAPYKVREVPTPARKTPNSAPKFRPPSSLDCAESHTESSPHILSDCSGDCTDEDCGECCGADCSPVCSSPCKSPCHSECEDFCEEDSCLNDLMSPSASYFPFAPRLHSKKPSFDDMLDSLCESYRQPVPHLTEDFGSMANGPHHMFNRSPRATGPAACQWQQCNADMPNAGALEKHIFRDHIIPQDLQICPLTDCSKKIASQQVTNHIVREHSPAQGAYVCLWQSCEFKAHNMADLDDHIKKVHVSVGCHWADCDATAATSDALQSHVRSEHLCIDPQNLVVEDPSSPLSATPPKSSPVRVQNRTCMWITNHKSGSTCGQLFDNGNDLQYHVEEVHTQHLNKTNGLVCSWLSCPRGRRSFPQRSKLNIHIASHTGYKDAACEFCGKEFSSRYNLESHKRVHTGEKPFECPECGERFTFDSQLSIHRKNHKGEKPLKCDKCGYQTADSSNFSKHKQTHEPPRHACGLCGHRFTRSSGLKRHIDDVHNKESKKKAKPSRPSSMSRKRTVKAVS
ncbi:hypothetical protein MMC20_004456 [Loxospora ochrophaea]|nr:hypothetical protein [Loxospora ochrophaea]